MHMLQAASAHKSATGKLPEILSVAGAAHGCFQTSHGLAFLKMSSWKIHAFRHDKSATPVDENQFTHLPSRSEVQESDPVYV